MMHLRPRNSGWLDYTAMPLAITSKQSLGRVDCSMWSLVKKVLVVTSVPGNHTARAPRPSARAGTGRRQRGDGRLALDGSGNGCQSTGNWLSYLCFSLAVNIEFVLTFLSTSWPACLHVGRDDSALLQAQTSWKLARRCPGHFFWMNRFDEFLAFTDT